MPKNFPDQKKADPAAPSRGAGPLAARTVALIALAMCAFAANSILCRVALAHTGSDPASFTLIRILAGSITLVLIALWGKRDLRRNGSWKGAFSLFTYAIAFSVAYVGLSAGTGALLLFGAVQATMILSGLYMGERLRTIQWAGLLTAFTGLVVLVAPGIHAPDPWRAVLMAIAGMAWGVYSLLGRKESDPLASTASNFVRATPLALLLLPFAHAIDSRGIALAVLSGSVSSGMGYALWYHILPSLKAAQAASVQLTVPVIASIAAIFILGENPTINLAVASMAILGGVGLVIRGRASQQ